MAVKDRATANNTPAKIRVIAQSFRWSYSEAIINHHGSGYGSNVWHWENCVGDTETGAGSDVLAPEPAGPVQKLPFVIV